MYNKPCDIEDWKTEEFRRITLEKLYRPETYLTEIIERKLWEWVMGFSALEHYGYLKDDKIALGVGCGHEPFMYTLANHIKLVIGSDLYGITSFKNEEANEQILRNPKLFCPFKYNESNLIIRNMNACDIDFADNSFDIMFSFSSLEHFGNVTAGV